MQRAHCRHETDPLTGAAAVLMPRAHARKQATKTPRKAAPAKTKASANKGARTGGSKPSANRRRTPRNGRYR